MSVWPALNISFIFRGELSTNQYKLLLTMIEIMFFACDTLNPQISNDVYNFFSILILTFQRRSFKYQVIANKNSFFNRCKDGVGRKNLNLMNSEIVSLLFYNLSNCQFNCHKSFNLSLIAFVQEKQIPLLWTLEAHSQKKNFSSFRI